MKRSLTLVLFCIIIVGAEASTPRGNINFVVPGTYQIAYPNQVIHVYFEGLSLPGENVHMEAAELNEQERYAIVKTFKTQLDLLPTEFINSYLSIDIYPYVLHYPKTYGLLSSNKLVIDIDQIRPGASYKASIQTTMLHLIGKMVLQRNFREPSTQSLINYLEQFYLDARKLPPHLGTELYRFGFVSSESSWINDGKYSAIEEAAGIFAHMYCPESNATLQSYLRKHPDSDLAAKITHYADYMETLFPEFDWSPYFSVPTATADISNTVDLNSETLLAAHEYKSNEGSNFGVFSFEEEKFEPVASTETWTPTEVEYEESEPYVYERSDEIDTIIGQKTTKKKKKNKRKKDGTGLLIVGGLLYLTLQLLSQ